MPQEGSQQYKVYSLLSLRTMLTVTDKLAVPLVPDFSSLRTPQQLNLFMELLPRVPVLGLEDTGRWPRNYSVDATFSPFSSERDLQIQIRVPGVSDQCAVRQVWSCETLPVPWPQSLPFSRPWRPDPAEASWLISLQSERGMFHLAGPLQTFVGLYLPLEWDPV